MCLGQYSAVQRRTCLAVQAVFMAKLRLFFFYSILPGKCEFSFFMLPYSALCSNKDFY